MLDSFYLFVTPLLVASFYVCYKFVIYREEIRNFSVNSIGDTNTELNNLDIAKEQVFSLTDNLRENLLRFLTLFFHWVLHFFVLFLKLVSNLVDFLYIQSRDFFLKTATKEKDAVSTFWHHLKEYKKEKEEGK